MGERGGDAPGPLRGPGPARRGRGRLPRARRHGAALPRRLAAAVRRGRRDRPGDRLRPADRGAGPHRPPVVGRGPRRGPAREGSRRAGHGRDLPALPGPRPTTRYAEPDPARCACFVISPPLRSAADRDALWAGPGRRHARPRRDRPRRPTDLASRRPRRPPACRSTGSPTARPGIETLLTPRLQRGRRARPADHRADGRPPVDDPGRAVRAGRARARSRSARDADLVVFDPRRATHARAPPTSTTRATTRRTRGWPVSGAVRDVFVRGSGVIRDGSFVGRRGFGQFVGAWPDRRSRCGYARTA